jgi:membrane protease YdiL (CAAX protease family)
MRPSTVAWGRVAGDTAAAVALVVLLRPPTPTGSHLGFAESSDVVRGAPVVLALFGAMRRLVTAGRPVSAVAMRVGLFGLLALDEEIVWRRAVLGELLRFGALASWTASTAAFALAHRRRPDVHLATGALFGGIYLLTGALSAPVAAHWTYNLLADESRDVASG